VATGGLLPSTTVGVDPPCTGDPRPHDVWVRQYTAVCVRWSALRGHKVRDKSAASSVSNTSELSWHSCSWLGVHVDGHRSPSVTHVQLTPGKQWVLRFHDHVLAQTQLNRFALHRSCTIDAAQTRSIKTGKNRCPSPQMTEQSKEGLPDRNLRCAMSIAVPSAPIPAPSLLHHRGGNRVIVSALLGLGTATDHLQLGALFCGMR
jgi:hypothetical protein